MVALLDARPKHHNCPLVVGSSNKLDLTVILGRTGFKVSLNTVFSMNDSVISGFSNHSDRCSNIRFSDQFGFNYLFHD